MRRRHPSSSTRPISPDESKLLSELRALYAEVDSAVVGWTCDTSTDCCRFGITGREPYPSAIELAEVERAIRARGGLPKRRLLPLASERRCPLLSDEGRCLVYTSRPFGCRTFFCDRARGPVGERSDNGLPRETIAEITKRIADLSQRFAPADPGPRPLSRAIVRDDEGRRRK